MAVLRNRVETCGRLSLNAGVRGDRCHSDMLKFDSQGLVPVIMQDHNHGEIRMFAFATDAAVRKTLETGRATFWSRSRGELWQKGRGERSDDRGRARARRLRRGRPHLSSQLTRNVLHATRGPRAASSKLSTAIGGKPASSRNSPRFAGARAEASRRSAVDGDHQRSARPRRSYISVKFREADKLAHAFEKESEERVVFLAADDSTQIVVGLRSRSIALRLVLLAELARRLRARS